MHLNLIDRLLIFYFLYLYLSLIIWLIANMISLVEIPQLFLKLQSGYQSSNALLQYRYILNKKLLLSHLTTLNFFAKFSLDEILLQRLYYKVLYILSDSLKFCDFIHAFVFI